MRTRLQDPILCNDNNNQSRQLPYLAPWAMLGTHWQASAQQQSSRGVTPGLFCFPIEPGPGSACFQGNPRCNCVAVRTARIIRYLAGARRTFSELPRSGMLGEEFSQTRTPSG